MADSKQDEASKQKDENEKTGGIAGAGAGVIAGAQIGTVLLPIPVVGTVAGALVGGVLGSKVGKRVGGAILDKLDMNKSEQSSGAAGKKDVTAELERLAKLREQGVLSEEEFKAAKAGLLGL
jgi:phage tail tape-measure protein